MFDVIFVTLANKSRTAVPTRRVYTTQVRHLTRLALCTCCACFAKHTMIYCVGLDVEDLHMFVEVSVYASSHYVTHSSCFGFGCVCLCWCVYVLLCVCHFLGLVCELAVKNGGYLVDGWQTGSTGLGVLCWLGFVPKWFQLQRFFKLLLLLETIV